MSTTLTRTRAPLYFARGTAYDAAVLADSPAVYWKLADPAGTQTGGTDAIKDSSGNNRNGTVPSAFGVTCGSTGLVSTDSQTSATFNSGRVMRAYDASWMNTTEYSADAVINLTSLAQGTILGMDDTGTNLKWRFEQNTGKTQIEWKTAGAYKSLVSPASAIALNTTYHVAWTFKQGVSHLLYINGSQVASNTVDTGALNTISGIEMLCGSIQGGNAPLIGRIARAAVYLTQLSPARIAAHAALR